MNKLAIYNLPMNLFIEQFNSIVICSIINLSAAVVTIPILITIFMLTRLFYPLFFARRLAMVINIFAFEDWFIIQWPIFIYLSLLQIVYLIRVMPYIKKSSNYLSIFNESYVLLFGTIMIFMTDYLPDPKLKYMLGWNVLALIILVSFINILFAIKENKSLIKKGFQKIRAFFTNLRKHKIIEQTQSETYNQILNELSRQNDEGMKNDSGIVRINPLNEIDSMQQKALKIKKTVSKIQFKSKITPVNDVILEEMSAEAESKFEFTEVEEEKIEDAAFEQVDSQTIFQTIIDQQKQNENNDFSELIFNNDDVNA
ncbi:UNKNOWN [Stylonychia lemnae]|uniref:TRP C-terminal domain-containing protein n=1 Tax=Stylonychia lemnae TaxID=5949 RepID=A0A078A951_STYLE|nr:UNKNOWN [Stylonychia lemnae]|eukprot:CDW78754.1 UNKNOWN [Stylonychia lemnae]